MRSTARRAPSNPGVAQLMWPIETTKSIQRRTSLADHCKLKRNSKHRIWQRPYRSKERQEYPSERPMAVRIHTINRIVATESIGITQLRLLEPVCEPRRTPESLRPRRSVRVKQSRVIWTASEGVGCEEATHCRVIPPPAEPVEPQASVPLAAAKERAYRGLRQRNSVRIEKMLVDYGSLFVGYCMADPAMVEVEVIKLCSSYFCRGLDVATNGPPLAVRDKKHLLQR